MVARLWDRPEIRAVMAEPDLARRFEAQAVVLTPGFRRFTPLLLMLQSAVTSQPAAAAMLDEFDERRLDAAGKYARAAATTGQLAVSEEECRDVLWATLDGVQWHRLVGPALRGLARPALDFRIGHGVERGRQGLYTESIKPLGVSGDSLVAVAVNVCCDICFAGPCVGDGSACGRVPASSLFGSWLP